MELTEEELIKRRVVNRLRRAHGQLGAAIKAFETGATCRSVVTQLAAVSAAVDRAGFAIISTGMRHCLTDVSGADLAEGMEQGDSREQLSIEELEKLFMMLA